MPLIESKKQLAPLIKSPSLQNHLNKQMQKQMESGALLNARSRELFNQIQYFPANPGNWNAEASPFAPPHASARRDRNASDIGSQAFRSSEKQLFQASLPQTSSAKIQLVAQQSQNRLGPSNFLKNAELTANLIGEKHSQKQSAHKWQKWNLEDAIAVQRLKQEAGPQASDVAFHSFSKGHDYNLEKLKIKRKVRQSREGLLDQANRTGTKKKAAKHVDGSEQYYQAKDTPRSPNNRRTATGDNIDGKQHRPLSLDQ